MQACKMARIEMEYPREKYIDRLIERKDNGLIKVIAGSRKKKLILYQ